MKDWTVAFSRSISSPPRVSDATFCWIVAW